MTWSRRFDEPIKTPDGKTLRTLKDAAKYVLALPPKAQAEPAWQHAAEALRNAAEREIAWMWFARPAMMRALHGPIRRPSAIQRGRRGIVGAPPASWRGIDEAKKPPVPPLHETKFEFQKLRAITARIVASTGDENVG